MLPCQLWRKVMIKIFLKCNDTTIYDIHCNYCTLFLNDSICEDEITIWSCFYLRPWIRLEKEKNPKCSSWHGKLGPCAKAFHFCILFYFLKAPMPNKATINKPFFFYSLELQIPKYSMINKFSMPRMTVIMLQVC